MISPEIKATKNAKQPSHSPTRQAEEVFMDYFLNSLGPSNESEQRRAFIFEKVKQIVHKAYGKSSSKDIKSEFALHQE